MTVASEGGPRAYVQKSVAVQVVDATTGETLRTPLVIDGEYKASALSPNGLRFAAIDAATDRLSVWDVSKGEKLSAYDLAPKNPDLGGNIHTIPVVRFSPDSRRLVVLRSRAPTIVLDTDRGEPLPALKGADLWSGLGQFTADGRLLALSGSQLVEVDRQQQGLAGQQQGFGGGPGGGRAGGVAKKGNNPGFGGGGQQFPGGAPGGGGGGQLGPLGVRSFRSESGIGIWEVATGKQLRGWDVSASIAVHPTRPVVAILEQNSGQVRLGLWDFAANGFDKK